MNTIVYGTTVGASRKYVWTKWTAFRPNNNTFIIILNLVNLNLVVTVIILPSQTVINGHIFMILSKTVRLQIPVVCSVHITPKYKMDQWILLIVKSYELIIFNILQCNTLKNQQHAVYGTNT